jgi:hypothetical protein
VASTSLVTPFSPRPPFPLPWWYYTRSSRAPRILAPPLHSCTTEGKQRPLKHGCPFSVDLGKRRLCLSRLRRLPLGWPALPPSPFQIARQAMAQQLKPTGTNGLCSRRLRVSTPRLIPCCSRVGARNRAQGGRRAHVNNARNCAAGKHRARATRLHARAALVCTRDYKRKGSFSRNSSSHLLLHTHVRGLARVWALDLPHAERV